MSKTITIGGDRVGSGDKMTTNLHGYPTTTHDLSYVWKSSMTNGTIVPFMTELMTNGDEMHLNLDTILRSHPSAGAIFGTFKVQLDVFKIPIRFYNRALHNNKKGIGTKMNSIFLPQMEITARTPDLTQPNPNQQQISPDSLLHYLGISGIGRPNDTANPSDETITRQFSALSLLSYWDCVANYYVNQQEGIGKVCSADVALNVSITDIGRVGIGGSISSETWLLSGSSSQNAFLIQGQNGGTAPQVISALWITGTGLVPGSLQFQVGEGAIGGGGVITVDPNYTQDTDIGTRIPGAKMLYAANGTWAQLWIPSATFNTAALWYYIISNNTGAAVLPSDTTPSTVSRRVVIEDYDLTAIDDMREAILAAPLSTPFIIEDGVAMPWQATVGNLKNPSGDFLDSYSKAVFGGLALKCYQSDRFNNWLNSDWVDSITAASNINVSGGTLSMDMLNIQQKIYNYLNRVVLSGNSYKDWQEATYAHIGFGNLEIPEWLGGMSTEFVFDEVVSTATAGDSSSIQPLGTLAGRGVQRGKHSSKISCVATEPCLCMGLISITPRLDYSQGVKWFYRHKTMDDLRKPELSGIGFQDLLTDEFAAWDTQVDSSGNLTYTAVGKQPAWIEYTTNQNEVHGNFVANGSEEFMVLNRRYEPDADGITTKIKDVTTYIYPGKFSAAWGTEELTYQHFWVQIGVDLKMERVMSNVIIPIL